MEEDAAMAEATLTPKFPAPTRMLRLGLRDANGDALASRPDFGDYFTNEYLAGA